MELFSSKTEERGAGLGLTEDAAKRAKREWKEVEILPEPPRDDLVNLLSEKIE